jgi:hypothetical protein
VRLIEFPSDSPLTFRIFLQVVRATQDEPRGRRAISGARHLASAIIARGEPFGRASLNDIHRLICSKALNVASWPTSAPYSKSDRVPQTSGQARMAGLSQMRDRRSGPIERPLLRAGRRALTLACALRLCVGALGFRRAAPVAAVDDGTFKARRPSPAFIYLALPPW